MLDSLYSLTITISQTLLEYIWTASFIGVIVFNILNIYFNWRRRQRGKARGENGVFSMIFIEKASFSVFMIVTGVPFLILGAFSIKAPDPIDLDPAVTVRRYGIISASILFALLSLVYSAFNVIIQRRIEQKLRSEQRARMAEAPPDQTEVEIQPELEEAK